MEKYHENEYLKREERERRMLREEPRNKYIAFSSFEHKRLIFVPSENNNLPVLLVMFQI